jgi:hypothetical protein
MTQTENPTEGMPESGQMPDEIIAYRTELDGDGWVDRNGDCDKIPVIILASSGYVKVEEFCQMEKSRDYFEDQFHAGVELLKTAERERDTAREENVKLRGLLVKTWPALDSSKSG